MCPDEYLVSSNECIYFHDPATAETDCMDGCEFCATLSRVNEEGDEESHVICLDCQDHLFEHEGQCVDEIPQP